MQNPPLTDWNCINIVSKEDKVMGNGSSLANPSPVEAFKGETLSTSSMNKPVENGGPGNLNNDAEKAEAASSILQEPCTMPEATRGKNTAEGTPEGNKDSEATKEQNGGSPKLTDGVNPENDAVKTETSGAAAGIDRENPQSEVMQLNGDMHEEVPKADLAKDLARPNPAESANDSLAPPPAKKQRIEAEPDSAEGGSNDDQGETSEVQAGQDDSAPMDVDTDAIKEPKPDDTETPNSVNGESPEQKNPTDVDLLPTDEPLREHSDPSDAIVDEKLAVQSSSASGNVPKADARVSMVVDASAAMETDEVAPASKVETGKLGFDKEVSVNREILPKAKKHTRNKKMNPKVLEIRRRIQLACRDNDLPSAMDAYQEAIADDIRLEAQTFYNLLNLCDGLERSVHIGTPKLTSGADDKPSKDIRSLDYKTRQEHAFRLKSHMAKLKYPLNETAYTAIVKILSRNKEYEKAEQVLQESENVQQCRPKLRLYSTLLTSYCEDRRMEDALKCWLKLARRDLELSEREYLALMRCAILTGDIQVLERIVTNIAEEVAVPSKDSVAALLEWFVSAHAVHMENIIPKHADVCRVTNILEQIQEKEVENPPSMGPVVNTKGWNVSSAVSINTTTGALQGGCLKDCRLKPVPLSARAWADMKEANETIVLQGEVEGNTSKYQGGKKGRKRMDFAPAQRKAQWERFSTFLDMNGPFDVVIDAANVGYFKKSYSGAAKHVDYDQIDWVVKHFTKMEKRVLVVLHQRHFSRALMPPIYKPIQEDWERQGVLYKSPPGMNDDWFWMHAALLFKSLVLTNDEMRDHHFQTLAKRHFLRWKERHQIHFDFGEWSKSQVTGKKSRQVQLVSPAAYSRRVQRVEDGLVIPLAKRGDENRFLDGVHVASDDEPVEETYLCLRPAP